MRMKFNKSSQLLLVSAASLIAAALVTACGTLTTDFVFVTSSKAAGSNNYGQIDVFEINKQSGYMRHIPTSPFPSGGRNPVAEAVSTDQYNLYVVNEDDNTIVQFIIGNDGKVYPQNTVNTPGIYPIAVAVNGASLFVVDTYQPLPICSNADPCSGSIGVFPITVGSTKPPSDTIGAPAANGNLTYFPLCLTGYTLDATTQTWNCAGKESDVIVPTAINVLASGAGVFVTAYDATASPNVGYVFGFAVGSGGALTPFSGLPHDMGVGSKGLGIRPSAVASDPTSTYVFVTDYTNGIVVSYSIASGVITRIGDTPAGNGPSAIVADPKYPYLYVANSLDSTVTAYSLSSGALTSLGTYATGLQPVAIGIDPSTNHFLFTVNFLGSGINGSVSGFELSPTEGTLINSQDSPFTSDALPTAVTAIPHQATE
jgi:6-phosphogluconolactonase (cycloisomerase 2 family)